SDPSPPSPARRAGRRIRVFGRVAPPPSWRKEYHTESYNVSVASPTRERERVLIVGVAPKGTPRAVAEDHLDELERLVDTAGGNVVGRFVKERVSPDPATYIGKGSVAEIGTAARADRAGLVVFDDELSPGQVRNLEKEWGDGVRVLDRPGL